MRELLMKLWQRPTSVLEKPWDVLIVLDACRYDAFKQVNWLPGRLHKIRSVASSSGVWAQKTFRKQCSNVVYVSASPIMSYWMLNQIIGGCPFQEIVEVFRDGWDERTQTVHPCKVNEAFMALSRSPSTRYVLHYMQPHHPFIGAVAIDARGFTEWRPKMGFPPPKVQKEKTVWDLLADGAVSSEEVWAAYVSNLQLVLKYVEVLLPNLKGNVAITSDHGYILDAPAYWAGKPIDKVPYFEVSNSERG